MMKPWMTNKQIDLITSYLKPNYTMLEWGSGGSTLTFPKLVDKYYSIEHNPMWYRKVRIDLNRNNIKNVNLNLVRPNSDYFKIGYVKRRQFKEYVEKIKELNEEYFDIILIDGRARPYCAIESLKYIDDKSTVFIHDYFERPQYNWIEEYYNIIESLLDNQTLGVFKKKCIP